MRETATKPTRVGYARCSTAQQQLQSQLDALAEAGCDPVFSEKISTRIKVRPEFVKAMDYGRSTRMRLRFALAAKARMSSRSSVRMRASSCVEDASTTPASITSAVPFS